MAGWDFRDIAAVREGDRLVAGPGGWFDAGTEVVVTGNCHQGGVIARGLRAGVEDEEFCAWGEFLPCCPEIDSGHEPACPNFR